MNADTQMTLDEAVAEVLSYMTGLDLQYQPELDRYQAVTRHINRAQRSVATEKEWSFYSDIQSIGPAIAGDSEIILPDSVRPRMVGDDAVRLVDDDGRAVEWAYFLPRDALHKYPARGGLWCSVTRNRLTFSRAFRQFEDGYDIQVPVMREPVPFRLPLQPEDPLATRVPVPDSVRNQLIDFPNPDLVVLKAAGLYARSNPVTQPRAQDLDAMYKDQMYQYVERDERSTDSPFLNDFFVPVQNGLIHPGTPYHWHPHSDERR